MYVWWDSALQSRRLRKWKEVRHILCLGRMTFLYGFLPASLLCTSSQSPTEFQLGLFVCSDWSSILCILVLHLLLSSGCWEDRPCPPCSKQNASCLSSQLKQQQGTLLDRTKVMTPSSWKIFVAELTRLCLPWSSFHSLGPDLCPVAACLPLRIELQSPPFTTSLWFSMSAIWHTWDLGMNPSVHTLPACLCFFNCQHDTPRIAWRESLHGDTVSRSGWLCACLWSTLLIVHWFRRI